MLLPPSRSPPSSPTCPRQAFATLLLRLPILASPPQPCGRSPGRPTGPRSARARPAFRPVPISLVARLLLVKSQAEGLTRTGLTRTEGQISA
jgi:hypothetical protein